MHSESYSDGDSFSSFFKSSDEDYNNELVQEEEENIKSTYVRPVTVLTSIASGEASKFAFGHVRGSAHRAIQPNTHISTRSSVAAKLKLIELILSILLVNPQEKYGLGRRWSCREYEERRFQYRVSF